MNPLCLLLILMILALNLFPSVVSSAVVEDSKKEGALVLYASMSAPEIAKLTGEFEKKYPFIKVDTFRSNNERILTRVLTKVPQAKFLRRDFDGYGERMALSRRTIYRFINQRKPRHTQRISRS